MHTAIFRFLNITLPLMVVCTLLASVSNAATPAEEAESRFQEGVALNKERRFDDAIIEFAQAVKLRINTHKYHRALHRTYLATRRGRLGISFYKSLVRNHPKNPIVHYWLGRFYLSGRELDASVREFKKVTLLAPESEHGFISLGHVYARLDKNDEALDAYRKADALVPDIPIVLVGMGSIYFLKGAYDKAQRAYEVALEKDGSYLEARFNLGLIYEKKGKYGEAAEQWKTMIDADPNESEARGHLANLYFRAKLYMDAVREYSMLSRIKLSDPNIFFALGEAQILLAAELSDQADRDILKMRARESFERVVELEPQNVAAKRYLDRLKAMEKSKRN
ncbi:tetratricopeptide repeat protein [bacterium AH-315-L15]|nr:tetratricopeptide repeat protein [bacterium AH-315-L15]